MKPIAINPLIISAISGIGILCCGCQEKSEEKTDDTSVEEAAATEISNNLDLEVVISVFGESENLEDFENKLNEPERQISNLDLNEDGEVDYLRVVESAMDDTHLVNVQAVIGEDQYQDVASFDVERDEQGQTQVQVVGDPYVYGPDYVIRPTFARAPLVLAWFWGSSYRSWSSPYRWGHYPSNYRPWRSCSHTDYRKRVTHHRNTKHVYHYGSSRRSKNSVTLYSKSKRSDYASRHPSKSFAKRNKGVENRYKLDQKRGKTKVKVADKKRPVANQKLPAQPPKPTGKPSKPATKPSQPNTRPTQPATKPSKPSTRPTQPATKPSKPSTRPTQPAAKPSKPSTRPTQPATKPSKPAAKPTSKPSKPASKPAAKPSGKSGSKPAKQPTSKSKDKK